MIGEIQSNRLEVLDTLLYEYVPSHSLELNVEFIFSDFKGNNANFERN